jgi:glycosyltransferase involved in cell wall biosynthesis
MKILLLMPVWNEIDGLRVTLPKLEKSLFAKIVVVDGGSTDGSIEICVEHGIEVFSQIQTGIRLGMEEYLASDGARYDYILTFSPDGNCNPLTLRNFVAKCDGEADLVMGSRYADGTSSQDDDLITAFGNKFFTNTTNVLFGTKFTDVFSIYRAFKPDVVSKLALDDPASYVPFEKLLGTYLGWEPLMTFRVAKYGLKYSEVGVGEPARVGGQRKLQVFKWGAGFLMQLIRELWYRPKTIFKVQNQT